MRVDKKEGGRWKKRQTESETTRKEFTLRMRERERDGRYKESRREWQTTEREKHFFFFSDTVFWPDTSEASHQLSNSFSHGSNWRNSDGRDGLILCPNSTQTILSRFYVMQRFHNGKMNKNKSIQKFQSILNLPVKYTTVPQCKRQKTIRSN